jgi:hypothetical protein
VIVEIKTAGEERTATRPCTALFRDIGNVLVSATELALHDAFPLGVQALVSGGVVK